jgi:hypothetical protein
VQTLHNVTFRLNKPFVASDTSVCAVPALLD